jgi:hypothetical protein
MGQLAGLISRIERFKERVENPRPFYDRYRSSWLTLAKRVVADTLVALQPPDTDPQRWQVQVAEIADRVSIDFIEEADETGLILALPPRLIPDPEDAPAHFSVGNLSIDDVVRWVEAGRGKSSPDEPGKNLTQEQDAGKSDLQIAWRVMYALKNQKPGWDRLLDVLREYVGLEAESVAEALYPELLKAWLEYFSVRAVDSWRTYVHQLVQEI